jgi:hypothetical protein
LQIERWSSMAVRAMDATPADVHCRLLLVACGELKGSLAAKAESIAAGVARLVVEELLTRADEIGASYSNIHDHLQQSSGSAEDVVAMNEYLASCEDEMATLKSGIESDLEARLGLLATLNVPLHGYNSAPPALSHAIPPSHAMSYSVPARCKNRWM